MTIRPLLYPVFCVIFSSLPAITHLYLFNYSVELPAGPVSSAPFPLLSSLHILSAGTASSDPMLLAILSAPQLVHCPESGSMTTTWKFWCKPQDGALPHHVTH